MKLLDEPRLAQARFADDQHELAFARQGALPAALKQAKLLLAADKRRQRPRVAPTAAAARANDPEKLDRGRNALEFACALILGHEKPRDLPLHVRGHDHRARLGQDLDARGNIRRVAENFAVRLHDDRPGLDPDARFELRRAFGGVPGVEVGERRLDDERGAHCALGVVLLRLRIAEERHQPVAEPFQHVAAEAGHRLRRLIEICVDEVAPVFRVQLRSEARRSDEVAEHYRDRSALGGVFGLERRGLRWGSSLVGKRLCASQRSYRTEQP
jgi:hypothetical protein